MRYTLRIEAVSLTSVVVVHAKGDSHLEKESQFEDKWAFWRYIYLRR